MPIQYENRPIKLVNIEYVYGIKQCFFTSASQNKKIPIYINLYY